MITVYKAKLHTAGKTPEQILKDFDGPKPSDQVVAGIIKAYDLIDGIEVIIRNSYLDNYFIICEWNKEDDDRKIKELFYAHEQDPLIGTYIDNREVFDDDWDSGAYEEYGNFEMVIDKDDVEIIDKLN